MSHTPHFPGPDDKRSRQRVTLAAIARSLALLDGGQVAIDLRAAVADLTEQLALGPEPDVRTCPVCHRSGMRNASRCGYCWTALEPLTV